MSFDMDEDILQDFLIEAGEILEQLSEQLVELENDPENKDLLKLKKALFLIKISKNQKGEEILQGLINKDSQLSKIAQEILNK